MHLKAFVRDVFGVPVNRHLGKVLDQTKPQCHGEYPLNQPRVRALRSCHDCPFNHTCFESREVKTDAR